MKSQMDFRLRQKNLGVRSVPKSAHEPYAEPLAADSATSNARSMSWRRTRSTTARFSCARCKRRASRYAVPTRKQHAGDDASNLGWKRAATVRGTAPPGLLDTYTAERHPVAAAVLENTRAPLALMRPDFATTALRNVVTQLMGTDDGNRYFGELISGVRARYDLGSDDPLVGCTGKNYALAGAARAFALIAGGAALLVDGTGGAASALCASYAPRVMTASALDTCSYLLRPDVRVAWTSADRSTDGLQSALERWFGAPPTHSVAA